MNKQDITVGIVGARGHVGVELMRLLHAHPRFRIAFASSRELAGQPLSALDPVLGDGVHCTSLDPAAVAARNADVVVLALPNGMAAAYVEAIATAAPQTVILDLSADYRFDEDWHYGLPELVSLGGAGEPQRAKRISNPGCYATAMQFAITPMRADLAGPVQCFGVSGYSGAGTTPSDKNDPAKLRDNLMPYALVDHLHEREVAHRLGHAIEFMPHVAAHFRGITLTANLHLAQPITRDVVMDRYRAFYAHAALVNVQSEAPWVSVIANRHGAILGGFALDSTGTRLVVVCVLDNLLKGAATQALQNLNLAFGRPQLEGITP
ncbi:MAG: N-acetyl-gamma-glutamyl-phosphate reductase [Dokdonella sp.]